MPKRKPRWLQNAKPKGSNIDGNAAAKGDDSGEGSGILDGTPVASGEESDTVSELAQPSHSKV